MKKSTERACFIINPKAAAGLAGRNISKLESAIATVFEEFRIYQTKAPKHATELAKKACIEGFDIIVSVGGDGTCHEVINGLIENDQLINPKSPLLLFLLVRVVILSNHYILQRICYPL